MYRVLLVEDEATVRDGIVKKIDWKVHGFELVGAFENGRQALDLLETQSVEVIITDINMPIMDGLALAKHVHENWPDIKVILLTGFDDFKFAQTAIRLKVHEYILKPITARQLRELLDKLRNEFDARISNREDSTVQIDESNRQGILAVEYIKSNYQNPGLSLAQMTAFLSVSTSHFSIIFKNYTGVTFIEFLTRLRMNMASELICSTDKKNFEIAAAVGYDDPGYFRLIFKKYTGLSPSEYRKKYRIKQ